MAPWMMAKSTYKQKVDFEKRKADLEKIKEHYPDRIPVIVEKAGKSDIPDVPKNKYIIQKDTTVGHFTYYIRKQINLGPEKAIFLFIDNVLPTTGALFADLYEEKRDEDGFLYVTYAGENTFGFL